MLQHNAPRKKWNSPRDNLKEDDVVLLVDDQCHRSQWKMARVEEAILSKDGLVRTVKLKLAEHSTFVRPVQKLIYLFTPRPQ